MTSLAGNRLTLNGAEGSLILAMRERMARSPRQLNDAFEADAELLDLGAAGLLAITVDTLNDGAELATAATPYAKGWLTTTVSVSDLAAVAADPVAVLVSCSLRPDSWTVEDAREFGRGASEAAERYGCHIVGGDTNWANEESFTSCALGTVPRGSVVNRMGARPGDALYVTGPIGAGNAVGFRALALGGTGAGEPWLPEARVAAAEPLRRYARACIDTSDGLLSAAVSLAELNGLGAEVVLRDEVYAPIVSAVADSARLPRWCSAAAEWGEFELLYAIDPADVEPCSRALSQRGLYPIHVGQLAASPELLLVDESGKRQELRSLLTRMRALDPAGSLLADLRALLSGGS
ncbi:thiamine-phosphate kinase [Micromonospora sp. CPCC 205558]|uniref:thiamine-phosphate kinase n=1 Tax=Micromonospora sp. CPCC 205558 TaxID=3122403 RepID=UPI002FF14714